jgi:hypothetical protein
VRRHCKPGNTVFSMVIDQNAIPGTGNAYRIVDEEHLGYELGDSRPRLQPRVLENLMRGSRTSESFRLRHGIIEYVFCFEA